MENANQWQVVARYPAPQNFANGDSALTGLEKLAKVPENVLALAEKYPTAAKLIHAAVENQDTDGEKTHTVHDPQGKLIGHVVSKYVPLGS